jgi:tetratricopeptide (TPR) repeat protein
MDSDSLDQIVEDSDRAYAAREEIQNVRESVAYLRNLPARADEYELAWRLSRALFFLGQESREKQSARDFQAEGVKAGKQATRLAPARVEGHFWLGVNLALLASLEPKTKAAAHALKARRALQKAISLDASYHAAGPLRVLARLQHRLPQVLGGGIARARENYERAISIAPANTVTRIYFAELLLDQGESERAQAELQVALNARLDPVWSFEINRDQQLAKEMIGKLVQD